MKKGLISIIVPVYKVEEYLDRCVESLVNQTYTNLEIILVDDGSPDNSGKLCDEWALKDKRIKVIHKENGGLSDARNKGLDIAIGEYICFVDSDDYLNERYVEQLYDCIIRNNVKISQCNIIHFFEDGTLERINDNKNDVVNSRDIVLSISKAQTYNVVVWNKMYHYSLFNNIRFPFGKIHEDEFTTYKLYELVDKVGTIDSFLYYYRSNSGGITGSKFNLKRMDILEAIVDRINYYKEIDSELYYCNIKNYLITNKKLKIEIIKNKLNKSNNIIKELDKNFNEYYHDYFLKNSVKDNKHLFLLKHIPFYTIIYNYYNKIKRKLCKLNCFLGYKLKSISLKKKIFILGIPEHGNLGDQAIIIAENKFLKDKLSKIRIIEIPSKFVLSNPKIIKNIIKNNVILYTGGGFLGSIWMNEEEMFRATLELFPKNRIIVLPQTFYFSNDYEGCKILNESREIYSQHKNLYLICREAISYNFMKREFSNKVYLFPDMVLYMDILDDNKNRDNVLVCLRKDKEKLTENSNILLEKLKEYKIDYSDTVVDYSVNSKNRSNEVKSKLNEFSKHKLVITDRLHGMIFSYLSQTPCIVVNSKSHKVKGVYKWIEKCNFIKIYDKNTLEEDLEFLLNIKEKKYNNNILNKKYDELVNLIREGL